MNIPSIQPDDHNPQRPTEAAGLYQRTKNASCWPTLDGWQIAQITLFVSLAVFTAVSIATLTPPWILLGKTIVLLPSIMIGSAKLLGAYYIIDTGAYFIEASIAAYKVMLESTATSGVQEGFIYGTCYLVAAIVSSQGLYILATL